MIGPGHTHSHRSIGVHLPPPTQFSCLMAVVSEHGMLCWTSGPWAKEHLSGHRFSPVAGHTDTSTFPLHCFTIPLPAHWVLVRVAQVKSSWTSGLVHSVGENSVEQERPYVVVHRASGTAFVVVATLGPALLGWPLRVVPAAVAGDIGLAFVEGASLEAIFVVNAFPRDTRAHPESSPWSKR